ncbi:hypothetical protein B566_EDAN011997 [Ephemera danica]|nr:hypothetical protein B566_EDAN011997 [Ephemera danica]
MLQETSSTIRHFLNNVILFHSSVIDVRCMCCILSYRSILASSQS